MRAPSVLIAVSCLGATLLSTTLVRAQAAENRGGTLRVVVSADFGAIEPALVTSYDGTQVMSATQLSLLRLRDTLAGGPRIVPYGAAQLPTISRDGKTYTFQIRPGLRFSDGSPVTARNFLEGFERLLDPRLHAQRAFLFDDVSGVRAFTSGKAAHVSGVVATKGRLVVHLARPAPDILDSLALPIVTAMPLDLPIAPGGVPAPLPSAGPYYAQAYEPGRMARLVRNPYWNPATLPSRTAEVDEIVYLGRTPDEAAATVSRGDADVATIASPELLAPGLVRDLMQRYGLNGDRFFVRPRLGRVSVVFNARSPHFGKHANLRRAVNFALDRTQLVAAHGPLAGLPTDQLLLPGRPGYRDWKLYPFTPDLVAAKQLMGGALRRRDVSLYVPTTSWGPSVGALVQSNLAPLGLDVRVKTLPTAVFTNVLSMTRTPWDLAVSAVNTARGDPVTFINFTLDGQHINRPLPGLNLGRFDEPEWNARMRRVARLRSGREAAFARLDRDLMRTAAPLAPYLAANSLTIFSDRVGCPSWTFDGWPDLAGLCIK
jgi:peptide/nickel transport system substrate-binding protein